MITDWINTLMQGLLLGGLYALFATGLSLSFGIMRMVNIAHGDLIVLAGFGSVAAVAPLINSGGSAWWAWASLLLVVPAMAMLAYALQRLVLNRTLGHDILSPLLVTFGLSIIVQNLMLEVFSADVRRLDTGDVATMSWSLGDGVAIGVLPLITAVCAVGVIVGLQWLFRATAIGRAFRAASDDPVTAQLMGIHHKHLYGLAMAIAGAIIALAGTFLIMRSTLGPMDGPARLLYAFEAVIIGGLGSLWGTLAGGILLGIAQAIGAAFDPGWGILAGHLMFLVVLVLKPNGLFPKTRDR
ncbi:branched-chain amino acid ABC transporter permease [Hydrogenophaga sp. 5NK40-0174]|uniref:branched-chain amino acid ABC transporter permease n=1 Tax=Hydrogenophaga sp. 5NK40-0174 TaxID=3127649 RepID=UPI003105C4E6